MENNDDENEMRTQAGTANDDHDDGSRERLQGNTTAVVNDDEGTPPDNKYYNESTTSYDHPLHTTTKYGKPTPVYDQQGCGEIALTPTFLYMY